MTYSSDYVKWIAANGSPGAPGPAELAAALQRICTLIGAGANAIAAEVTAWAGDMPGPDELATVLDELRTAVGDDDGDYTIDWDGIDAGAEPGYPGPEELGALLIAIAASV